MDGQDWEAVTGDEARGAAVLHKEMSALEEPPGHSRDKGQATEASWLASSLVPGPAHTHRHSVSLIALLAADLHSTTGQRQY